jgi:hypothetical protein
MAHFVNYTIDVLNEAYIDHIFWIPRFHRL